MEFEIIKKLYSAQTLEVCTVATFLVYSTGSSVVKHEPISDVGQV